MDIAMELNVIYAYLEGLVELLADLSQEVTCKGDDEEKHRMRCAAELSFLEYSVESFMVRVGKAWEAAEEQQNAVRKGTA